MAVTRLEVYLALDYEWREVKEIRDRIRGLKRKVGDPSRISLSTIYLHLSNLQTLKG